MKYGYTCRDIKLSSLLAGLPEIDKKSIPDEPKLARARALMQVGDELCANRETASAVALLGVRDIAQQRAQSKSEGRDAWIIDSLKRPDEVATLRQIYGERLIFVAAKAPSDRRTFVLSSLIRQELYGKTSEYISAEVATLIRRDHDQDGPFTQNVLRTFPLADYFVDVEGDVNCQVSDLFDLLFDAPSARPPTDSEYGMHLAWATSLLSQEMGLKVGAAILKGGHVISTGFNSHPFSLSAPDFDPSRASIADLLAETISGLVDAGIVSKERLQVEDRSPDDAMRNLVLDLLRGNLKSSRLASLIEFQAPVHAEMNALIGALEGRADVGRSVIYITDYPCHACAKHLLRLEMRGIYLQPYPKSRAEAMYGTVATHHFEPFVGVAPRLYGRLFTSRVDRKTIEGSRVQWGRDELLSATLKIYDRLSWEEILAEERKARDDLSEESESRLGSSIPIGVDVGTEDLSTDAGKEGSEAEDITAGVLKQD